MGNTSPATPSGNGATKSPTRVGPLRLKSRNRLYRHSDPAKLSESIQLAQIYPLRDPCGGLSVQSVIYPNWCEVGVAQNSGAGVTQVFVFGFIYQGAVWVHFFEPPSGSCPKENQKRAVPQLAAVCFQQQNAEQNTEECSVVVVPEVCGGCTSCNPRIQRLLNGTKN